MGVTIGFRKNLEAQLPALARDAVQRRERLARELREAEEEHRWLLQVAGAAGVTIPPEVYLMDATAADDSIAA
jgi:hypothetical protein